MLRQSQIRKAIQAGFGDGETAARESGEDGAPADGWDGWLVNSIGGKATAELFGLKQQDGEDWQTALSIYHEAACMGAAIGAAEAETAGTQSAVCRE